MHTDYEIEWPANERVAMRRHQAEEVQVRPVRNHGHGRGKLENLMDIVRTAFGRGFRSIVNPAPTILSTSHYLDRARFTREDHSVYRSAHLLTEYLFLPGVHE